MENEIPAKGRSLQAFSSIWTSFVNIDNVIDSFLNVETQYRRISGTKPSFEQMLEYC